MLVLVLMLMLRVCASPVERQDEEDGAVVGTRAGAVSQSQDPAFPLKIGLIKWGKSRQSRQLMVRGDTRVNTKG